MPRHDPCQYAEHEVTHADAECRMPMPMPMPRMTHMTSSAHDEDTLAYWLAGWLAGCLVGCLTVSLVLSLHALQH